MRASFSGVAAALGFLLLASMVVRTIAAARHSPEVASASALVVASSANARTAPVAEAGRSNSFQGDVR